MKYIIRGEESASVLNSIDTMVRAKDHGEHSSETAQLVPCQIHETPEGEKEEEENNGSALSHSDKFRFLACFYSSHFLCRWGSRMWEFSVSLFMISILPDSLLLVSLYGLVENLAIVALGISVGKWVDNGPRLQIVRISLCVRNGSVMAAAFIVQILLQHPKFAVERRGFFIFLIVLVNIFGGFSALATLATNIAIERDWVLAIAAGKRIAALEDLNSGMRSIDLTCKLVAPIVVGIIMSFVSVSTAAIVLSVWNIVSIGLEYFLLTILYNQSPELQRKGNVSDYCDRESAECSSMRAIVEESQKLQQHDATLGKSPIHEDDIGRDVESSASSHATRFTDSMKLAVGETDMLQRRGLRIRVCGWITNTYQKALHLHHVEGCKTYLKQEMLLAANALAMLYFTVLSFGPLMTASLNWRGIPVYILSLVRGIAAVIGICGALLYPKVHSHLQVVRTGLWAITIQWTFLFLCVASWWVPNSVASSTLLMAGVCMSRFGLWMFDLAVLQLMQESVSEDDRGVVGGVQTAIQSFMEMMTFCAGMIISNPADFDKLIYLSYASVTTAVVLYSIQVYRVRGHIFHWEYFWDPVKLLIC